MDNGKIKLDEEGRLSILPEFRFFLELSCDKLEQALIETIYSEPFDNWHRLRYLDYLEERGRTWTADNVRNGYIPGLGYFTPEDVGKEDKIQPSSMQYPVNSGYIQPGGIQSIGTIGGYSNSGLASYSVPQIPGLQIPPGFHLAQSNITPDYNGRSTIDIRLVGLRNPYSCCS